MQPQQHVCNAQVGCHVSLQGVANRDIKLENTLLDGSPRPLLKICDFGYSKVPQCCADQLRNNPCGALLSSFLYSCKLQ